MASITRFATDRDAELKGVWLPAGAGLDLCIARLGNDNYIRFMRQHGKGLIPSIRAGLVENKEMEDLVKDAAAKTVLLNWRNLEDEKGKEIPYSKEKALELFNSHPDFFKIVLELANDAANFRAATVQESQGNSLAASSGS